MKKTKLESIIGCRY